MVAGCTMENKSLFCCDVSEDHKAGKSMPKVSKERKLDGIGEEGESIARRSCGSASEKSFRKTHKNNT